MISITLLVLWRNGTYTFESFNRPEDKDFFLSANNAEILQVREE